MFTLEDQIWRYYKVVAANAFDRCSPFPIAWLKNLMSALSIGICNDYAAADNAHYKTGLVKVVEICILDRILFPYIVHQPKPRIYKLGIFAEGPLFIISTRQARLKFGAMLYKAVCPLLAGQFRTTRRKEEIGYIAHPSDPGRKSSCI